MLFQYGVGDVFFFSSQVMTIWHLNGVGNVLNDMTV